jgi:PTH1 family peptidyl-tRNA hydrolase
MALIVGLGNPGKKFEKTRHNLGFLVVESLKSKIKSFSNWKKSKKFLSEISEGKINNEKVILAKPQTFMNNSGKAVKPLIENCKLKIENLIVVHDDLDLPLGKIKISLGRGSGGHKGVQSIIEELGTKNFVRLRIGIQPKNGKPERPEKFVLQRFKKEEEKIIKKVIKKTIEVVELLLKEGLEKAMTEFNK